MDLTNHNFKNLDCKFDFDPFPVWWAAKSWLNIFNKWIFDLAIFIAWCKCTVASWRQFMIKFTIQITTHNRRQRPSFTLWIRLWPSDSQIVYCCLFWRPFIHPSLFWRIITERRTLNLGPIPGIILIMRYHSLRQSTTTRLHSYWPAKGKVNPSLKRCFALNHPSKIKKIENFFL